MLACTELPAGNPGVRLNLANQLCINANRPFVVPRGSSSCSTIRGGVRQQMEVSELAARTSTEQRVQFSSV